MVPVEKIIASVSKNRKTISWLLLIGYMIFSFIYIIKIWNNIDTREYLLDYKISSIYTLLTFVVQSIGFFFSVYIWQNILRSYNLNTKYFQDFKRCTYSLLSIMLPGKVFYHLGRMTLYHNDGFDGRVVGIAGISEVLFIGIGSLSLYTICYLIFPGTNLITNVWLLIILALLSMVPLIPSIFNKIVLWINQKVTKSKQEKAENYSFIKGALWMIGEILVLLMGGVSLYFFISAFYKLDINDFTVVISVWAAASASSSFLFWLPGSFLVKDGAMLIVLQKIIPNAQLAFSIIVFHRIWIMLSNLILSLFVWLLFDCPRLFKQKQ